MSIADLPRSTPVLPAEAGNFDVRGAEAPDLETRGTDTRTGQSFLASIRLLPAASSLLVAAACSVNTIDLNYAHTDTGGAAGLQLQVVMKLVVAAAAFVVGLIGLGFLPAVRAAAASIPGSLLATLALAFLVTAPIGLEQSRTDSIGAACIFVAYLLFIPTALASLGLRRFAVACLVGLLCNLALNWISYFFFPDIGVFQEQLWGGHVAERMGGLGHPNAIARLGVLAGLISLSMMRERFDGERFELPPRSLLVAVLIIAVLTAVFTISRTAVVAGIAGVMWMFVDRWRSRIAWILLLGVGAVGVIGVIGLELATGGGMLDEYLLRATTKTGDLKELTSATGRTAIWAESIRLIALKPITGYGLNSSPILLADFSFHPHNVVLHAAVSGGVLAAFILVLLLGWNLLVGLRCDEPLVRAVSAYILVSGIFEDTILDSFASPSTMLWLVALIYPTIHAVLQRPTLRTAMGQPI